MRSIKAGWLSKPGQSYMQTVLLRLHRVLIRHYRTHPGSDLKIISIKILPINTERRDGHLMASSRKGSISLHLAGLSFSFTVQPTHITCATSHTQRKRSTPTGAQWPLLLWGKYLFLKAYPPHCLPASLCVFLSSSAPRKKPV